MAENPTAASDEAIESTSVTIARPLSPNTEKAIQDLMSEQPQSTVTAAAATTSTAVVAATSSDVDNNQQQLQQRPSDAKRAVAASANEDETFENLQRAVRILGKAKHLDDTKQFEEALKNYRQGVDMLLEELIVRQGTDQSRSYLRGKCNDFMNRIGIIIVASLSALIYNYT